MTAEITTPGAVSVVYNNFGRAWFDLLRKLRLNGDDVNPRDQGTTELLNAHVIVTDMRANILAHPNRALNYRFMVAEWLWIAAGRSDVATIAQWNKNIAQFSDNGLSFNGAYGPRLAPQINWLLEQLRKSDTRQAVASIWTPTPAPSKDIPCTLTWQVLARRGQLHAIVNMRSSDIWLGLPYDFFNFSMLTMGLAGELGLEPGSIGFNLGSSHLYNRDRVKADAVLAMPGTLRTLHTSCLPGAPPANSLLNGWQHADIVWKRYADALAAPTSAAAFHLLEGMGGPQ